ncbi:hypothetical protein [Ilumatobacter sp.]|uniref:hypothetical protein n=1 Tax=Ilumatobacter sp. TaxID=1967498 RepID=UPI003AF9EDDD
MAEVLILLCDESLAPVVGSDAIHRASRRLLVADDQVLVSGTLSGVGDAAFIVNRGDTITTEFDQMLTAEERLFAQSWLLRRSHQEKDRPADGVDWDAGGREVPDATSIGDACD